MGLSLEIRLLAILALVAGLIAGAVELLHQAKAAGRAECQAAYAAQAREQFNRNEHTANDAAGQFQAQSAAITERHTNVQATLRSALAAPVSCTPGPLASVRVPAAVLGGLRDAAAGPGADPAAASQSGSAVRSGTDVPGR